MRRPSKSCWRACGTRKRLIEQAGGIWEKLHTRFEVRSREGKLLGIFPTPMTDSFDAIRALIEKHPGAEVRSTVSVDNPCSEHSVYEADNCPSCGTAGSWRGPHDRT